MIYQLTSNFLIPGKMPEYFKLAEAIQPVYPKVGIKIVGSWHGYTGDMNVIHVLYAYDDLAAYAKARETASKTADYRNIVVRVPPLCVSQNLTLLEPNPWSPMK